MEVLPPSNELNGKKIAIFGLSANPPTGDQGHVGIVKFLVGLSIFDEIWILPVYIHQFSTKRDLEPFKNRIQMCKLCMENLSTDNCVVRILELEKVVNERIQATSISTFSHGTIDTIEFINQHVKCELHLIVGGDAYNDIAAEKWKDGLR